MDVIQAIRKRNGFPLMKINWVYDFFLAHLTNTRELVMTGHTNSPVPENKSPVPPVNSPAASIPQSPPAAGPRPSTPAHLRAQEYIAMKKSVGTLQPVIKDEDDPDGDNFEQTETIDIGGESEKKHVTIEDFDLLKVLGRGAFGKVLQVRKKDTGKIYAMKILKKSMVYQRKQVAHTQAERKILEAAQHPFLMGLRFAFQSETKLYLVMDFFKGGELFFHLKKKKKFTEDESRIIVAEVALALGHLHSNNFIYRDLKPENVLLHETGHICVTDFGLSKALDPDQKDTHTMCGTPEYLRKAILKFIFSLLM